MSGNRAGTVGLFQSVVAVAFDGTGVTFTLGSAADVDLVAVCEDVSFDDVAYIQGGAIVKSELSEHSSCMATSALCEVTLQRFVYMFAV